MPLSLNEIRERARAFSKEWAGESSERAEAQSFWNDFFEVFGVKRKRVAVFEQKAARFTGSTHGRIDVFWPGVMLAEHKSEGRDLDAAYQQATDYFAGLKDAELPRFVLVSDFQRFRLHDLETGERSDFALAELHKQIGRFGFISGYQTRSYKEEDPVNVQAAERMGRLHDALKAAGYDGHALELLLVRLLFCLFADDTGIFPRQSFHDLIAQRTSEDGADLGMWVGRIFQVLNTAPEKRQTTLDEQLAELPYVNGRLFEELLPLADFNAQMRGLLLDAARLLGASTLKTCLEAASAWPVAATQPSGKSAVQTRCSSRWGLRLKAMARSTAPSVRQRTASSVLTMSTSRTMPGCSCATR